MTVETSSGTGCLSNDRVLGLREGTLDEDVRRAAVEHIEGCTNCLQLVGRLQAPAPEPPPDARLALDGRFEIREALGRGGMGVVYRAFDLRLDREVAIKLLHDAMFEADAGARARLLAESKAMARLRHPNVVAVYDVVLTDQHGFVVMELVGGGTLRSWLERRQRSWKEVSKMFVAAGRGLSAAHEAGLIHRDFKPDNVLVDDHDRPLVTDFGLANAITRNTIDESLDEETPIVTAGRCGTPAYMPPEQLEGRPVDARADVFAFCVALWEAVAGHRPFAEDSLHGRSRAIQRHALQDAERGVMPARLRRILGRGLRADPDARPRDMSALLRELETLIAPSKARYIWLPALALGVTGVGLALAQGSQPQRAACPKATQLRALEDQQLDRLERRLADDASELGAASSLMAAQIRQELETYDRKLSITRAETCALVAPQEISAAELALRNACLDRLDSRLHTVFELVHEGTPQAFEELGSPRKIDRCARWASASAPQGATPPSDPELPRLLARVSVVTAVSHPKAPELARQAVDRAEALEHPSSVSEAHLHLASALWVLDRQAALASMDAAADAARRAEDPVQETAVWVSRSIFFSDDGDAPEVNRALEQAERAIERISTPWIREEFQPLLKTAQSMSALFDGNGELALERAIEARDLAREHRPALVPTLTEQVATMRGIDGDMEGVLDEWSRLAAWHEARGPSGAIELTKVLIDIADTEAALGRSDSARARLDRAEALTRTVPVPTEVPVLIAATRANVALADEDLDAALRASNEAVRLAPDASSEHRDALSMKAHVLLRMGRTAESIEILEGLRAALDLEPEDADFGLSYDILVDLAEAHRRHGDPERALQLIEPVWTWFLDNYPELPEVRLIALYTAWAYADLERDAEAEALFAEVLAASPREALQHWAHVGLATLEARRGSLSAETRETLGRARTYFGTFPDSRAHELDTIDAIPR